MFPSKIGVEPAQPILFSKMLSRPNPKNVAALNFGQDFFLGLSHL